MRWEKKYSIDRKLPVMSHSPRTSVLWTRWLGLPCNRTLILGLKEFTDTRLLLTGTYIFTWTRNNVPDFCHHCYNSGSWCGYMTIFSPLPWIVKCLKSSDEKATKVFLPIRLIRASMMLIVSLQGHSNSSAVTVKWLHCRIMVFMLDEF